MKKHINYLFILCICFSCENPSDSKVENEIELDLIISEQSISYGALYIKGDIVNTGNITVTPFWYIIADFYVNDTSDFKLGEESYSFSWRLSNNETHYWYMFFSSEKYEETEYPDFCVKNFRFRIPVDGEYKIIKPANIYYSSGSI